METPSRRTDSRSGGPSRPLIMDVGGNNGDDTAFYLHRGYRVVTVEANPVLAKHLRVRFAGQPVVVENVCIGPSESESVEFWVNRNHDAWSAFDHALATREGTEAYLVELPSTTLRTLLDRHGMPEYIKIDIEGMDRECLKSLDSERLPKYISLELSNDEIIDELSALGYGRFKIINQGTFTTSTPIFPNQYAWRLLRKTRIGRFLPNGLKHDFDTFHRDRKWNWTFNEGTSGPFGVDTFGPWLTVSQAKQRHERNQEAFVRGGLSLGQCWYDVHATQ
jgi:FkbM family methyltransferase